ncbi:MAG TPA: CAP domain-containing protein [Thermoanaerobaculia bacterium]|nr:CAP domain-containing protein [Thermoanaerobaculia bacterium]
MKQAFITLLLLTLATPLAQGEIDVTKATLREHVLKLINRDRKLYNLPPVQLDLTVSTQADDYCREQIRTGTTGHFGIDGLAPYMRYSIAGGNDGTSENAAAWSASYTFNDRALYEMSRRSQDAMMGELPPDDGHKKTILDPNANYVGIGLAWEKGEFRLVHEFIRRYVHWTKPLPRAAAIDQQVIAAGRPLLGTRIDAITVHHEPFPDPMPVELANSLHRYTLPEKRKDYMPRLKQEVRRRPDGAIEIRRQEYSDGTRGDFPVSDNGAFSFTIPFTEGEGVYTVVVWVRKNGAEQPIAATNVSIRVERSLPLQSRLGWTSTTTPRTTRSSSAPARQD